MRNTKDAAWIKEFTRRVRARMEELEISQAKLVKLTGMPQPTINCIVRGRYVPLTTHAVRIARALAMDVSDLVDFEVNA